MVFSPLKTLWLLSGLAAAFAAGHWLLVARPRQQATLARLAAVDSCLVARNRQLAAGAQATLASLARNVARNRNQAADVAVLQHARFIVATGSALADSLHRLARRWPAGSTPTRLARLSALAARGLDTLRAYAPGAAVDALPGAADNQRAANWLDGSALSHLPAPAARASLTRLETQVWRTVAAALNTQARKVGSACICFDKMGAFAAAVSTIVAPGKPYEARLYLTQAASGLKKRMLADGREIPFDPRTDYGLVTLRVPPARPGQPDTVRAQWLGEVQFNVNGVDSVQRVLVPYFIVKPPQL